VQDDSPDDAWYFPAGQATHSAALAAELDPAAHKVHHLLPSKAYLPAAQDEHAAADADPDVATYVPAAQSEQLVDPATANWPATQDAQMDEVVEDAVDEARPATQDVHAEPPVFV